MRLKGSSIYFLILVLLIGFVFTACQSTVEPEVVEKVIKETVVVEGTPQVVEKEVTVVVKEEVEKEVTRIVEVGETSEEAEEGPKYGGTFVYALQEDPYEWTPLNTLSCEPEVVFAQIWSALVRYNGNSELVGDLAESWEWLDEVTVVFNLRKNVTWHNGDPFVASDVVQSMEIRSDPLSSIDAETVNEFVDKWEALDDYTVKLTLKKPSVGIMRLLSAVPGHGFILHPDFDQETAGQSAETTIGTGPFMYESYEPGIAVKLVKNPNYFLEGMPYLDAIELRIIADAEAAMTGLKTGELDMIRGYEFQSYASLDADPNIYVPAAFGFYGSRTLIDTTLPPTDDVRVRQALNYAVDREMIVDAVLAGYGEPVWGAIVPEGRFGYSEELANIWSYDSTKAVELLAEAGWADTDGDGLVDKDGEPMTLRFVTWGPSWWSQTAEIIQANLKDIGITVELEPLPWAEYKAIREESMSKPKGEPGVAHLIGSSIWGLDLSDYYNYVGMYNFSRYDNPVVVDLLSKALSTTDDAEREAMFIQAQKLQAEDAMWICAAWASLAENVRTEVKNFHHLNETGCFAPLIWEVWLDE